MNTVDKIINSIIQLRLTLLTCEDEVKQDQLMLAINELKSLLTIKDK